MNKIFRGIVLVSITFFLLSQPAIAAITSTSSKKIVVEHSSETKAMVNKSSGDLKQKVSKRTLLKMHKPVKAIPKKSTYHYVDTPYENANNQKGKYNFDKPLDTYYREHPGVDASNNPYTHYSLPSGIY